MWLACFYLIKKGKTPQKNNVQVNVCVILSASIYLTIHDQHKTNFPIVFLK